MQAVSYTAQLFDHTHCNSVKEILVNKFKIQRISIGQAHTLWRQDVESYLQSQLLKCDILQQQNLYMCSSDCLQGKLMSPYINARLLVITVCDTPLYLCLYGNASLLHRHTCLMCTNIIFAWATILLCAVACYIYVESYCSCSSMLLCVAPCYLCRGIPHVW